MMLLMLSTTHETLIASLRAVHAAQLQVLQTKLEHEQEKNEQYRQLNTATEDRMYQAQQLAFRFQGIAASQQETIKAAMSDLVILKGAGRVRSEQEKPPDPRELRPDVEITGEPTDLADRRDLIRQAREEYEAALRKLEEEVDTSKVTAADVEAAMPATREDWEREHAQPTDSDDRMLVAGL